MTHLTHATLLVLAALAFFRCAGPIDQSPSLPPPPPAAPAPTPAPTPATGIVFKTVTLGAQHLDYAVYVPRAYDPAKEWPAIVFLHGSGESGTDGQKMIAVGIGTNILKSADRWPCIVIMPQKPDQKLWEDYDALVMAALDETKREYRVDPARIALTGLSAGGHGTWQIGAAHPDVWCSLVPICGFDDPKKVDALAAKLKGIPVWCFHGESDDVVPPARSRVIIDALNRAGAKPKFTLYPGVNHNSWDRAYAEPELPQWLMTPKKPAK